MRAMLATMMLAGCGSASSAGGADLSAAAPACPAVDLAAPADITAAPDLAPPTDLAACFTMGCPPAAPCYDYTNGRAELEYIVCCSAGGPVHCHDALGLGETCARSVCAPGATCANGSPNGGTTVLVLVCCGSPASAPALRCTAG